MASAVWLLSAILAVAAVGNVACLEENLADTIKLLREQVSALFDHRQEDYNALEGSLKSAIEKNTELFVLRNEVKQLRKDVNALRGGNGNEAKNEKLRVRWLGSAVAELQGEVAEVLRARNASEELAERSRMRSELALLKGDVAEVGRGIRNLGGRIAKIEAALGTVRVDIIAVKERSSLLSRTCADITSQLSAIQIEVKSLKCESSQGREAIERGRKVLEEALSSHGSKNDIGGRIFSSLEHPRSRATRRHGYSRRASGYRARLEERLRVLERKIALVSQKRASLEKRVAFEGQEYLSKRVRGLERIQSELSKRVSKVGEEVALIVTSGESLDTRLLGSMRSLEETIEANRTETKRELARLGVNAARKAAEISLTREELGNLKRTVQALSVSASKLQERSDLQEDAIDRLNVSFFRTSAKGNAVDLEKLGNRYRSISDDLSGICEDQNTVDGLRLIGAGQGTPMLVSCRDGSVVVGRRIDGTLDFDRTWEEYSIGFGSPAAEFWIGNEILHRLTRDNCSSLRINMLDVYGERWQAEYESFRVDSVQTGYKLHVDEYRGNASDALSYHNGMAFSAKDRDLDVSRANCAGNYHGGWWFGHCQHANLNGKFSLGLAWLRSDTKDWMPISAAEMSVRRKPTCRRDSK